MHEYRLDQSAADHRSRRLPLLLSAGLGACTTVEGTNALTDVGTFEREVATETLKGLGMVPQETKKP